MPFRREDRSSSEERMKRFVQQGNFGIVGSEHHFDYVVDHLGEKILIGGKFKGIVIDQHQIPKVESGIVSTTLDCSHTVASINDVNGICGYNHTVCKFCELYTCVMCGTKLCDYDVEWFQDNPVCPCHAKEILKEQISKGILGMLINFLGTLIGYDSYDGLPEYRPSNIRRIEE